MVKNQIVKWLITCKSCNQLRTAKEIGYKSLHYKDKDKKIHSCICLQKQCTYCRNRAKKVKKLNLDSSKQIEQSKCL